jgi:ADP-heptose:LPS heptosyltransferase
MRKLILQNFQSPGDIVMLTAAVRDLHLTYPGQYLTDVRTPCPQLWENNPYLTRLESTEPGVETIDCQYPLIHRSNQEPWHFLHAFIDFLNRRLNSQIKPTMFKGDIHLSAVEKSWISQVQEITRDVVPFWIVCAGGKYDYTIKWWDHVRYQAVVRHFRGKILFVQVGELRHHHPPLEDVLDLRGKTDLRQLIRLVYHSQGVLGTVSLLMHLAAAVETKPGMSPNRPCVVVAGGREPPHWEAYPHHQFIHTIGALRCCDNGGCWKSRTVPLGDGDAKDHPGSLCVDVVRGLPRCMDLVTADEVIRRIQLYFHGGAVQYLSRVEHAGAQAALADRSYAMAGVVR